MNTYRQKPFPQNPGGTSSFPNLTTLDIDEQFKLLRPSKELLYYRRKMNQVSREFEDMITKVERCKSLCERHHQFQQENQKQNLERFQLQKAVSDLQVYLYQEREQVLRLYAENDRLKICALQDRKKINYLLAMTSTSEKELNFICTKPWKDVVPQRIKPCVKNISASAKGTNVSTQAKKKSLSSVDIDTVIMQNQSLSSQLEEQTRLFQDSLHTLLKDRELQREEASVQIEQCQEKISYLSSELHETQRKLCDTVKETLVIKKEHLKSELVWSTERDMFLKSLEKFDTSFDHNVKGDGHCGRGHKHNITSELNLLKNELAQREQAIAMYQEECMLLDGQTITLKEDLETVKMKYKERIEKLQHVIAVLKKKYNQLDQRRRLEGEGYRNDVKLLKGRLQKLERSIIKLPLSRSDVKIHQNMLMIAADTTSKARRLRDELLLIKQQVLELCDQIDKNNVSIAKN